MGGSSKIDGWKAISSHFGKDRSTVMRWARDRDLPIHRVPGGKSGSVFAYASELDAWSNSTMEGDSFADVDENANSADLQARRPFTAKMWIGGGVALSILGVIALAAYAVGQNSIRLPPGYSKLISGEDAAVRRDFLLARDLWGRRTGEDIRQSIELYEAIIARSPDFAPAHAGLAEAWLVYREYGAASEADAYRKAKSAIDRALVLDAELPAAHRARGFLAYWWSYDGPTAEAAFRRSIALDPNDSTTHFWFANILSDMGRHAEAEREYDIARYLLPGFRPLEVERACSLWQAGRDNEAIQSLRALAQRYPDDATVHNCLAWAAIGRGDIDEFVLHYRRMADIRGEPLLLAQAAQLAAGHARNPATAHRTLIAALRQEFAQGQRQTRMTPAFYASSMGDRQELLSLLNEAIDLEEKWSSRTLVDRMRRKWRQDSEVSALIERIDQREAVNATSR